jgi:hypothetical protein
MMSTEPKRYRAGQTIEDHCRACKIDRVHTIIVTDSQGQPMRVSCGYCGSEHNYRGVRQPSPSSSSSASFPASPGAPSIATPRIVADSTPFPLVSERERTAPPVTSDSVDLELLLRRIIREESGLTAVAPAARWRGGMLVLRPGKSDLQEKTWPIETFFHKVVMLRNRLRTMEQQINATDLPEDVKVKLQGYISGCYGSLTSFNVLFADEADQFRGSGE